MLHEHLSKRFTAKWWDSEPLEQEKVDLILKCAYSAPSKQGHYDYKIYTITDSPEGKEFKQWLYWDNTACLNKIRGAKGEGLRRYNGQVLAPVVMIWLGTKFPILDVDKEFASYSLDTEWVRTNNDCIISATMAMCQAEELGVNTGFCGCIGNSEIADKLNEPNYTAVISVGFGYATPDKQLLRKVYDENNIQMGVDLSNIDPSIRTNRERAKRPAFDKMITYV
jgi:nitroreductase